MASSVYRCALAGVENTAMGRLYVLIYALAPIFLQMQLAGAKRTMHFYFYVKKKTVMSEQTSKYFLTK